MVMREGTEAERKEWRTKNQIIIIGTSAACAYGAYSMTSYMPQSSSLLAAAAAGAVGVPIGLIIADRLNGWKSQTFL